MVENSVRRQPDEDELLVINVACLRCLLYVRRREKRSAWKCCGICGRENSPRRGVKARYIDDVGIAGHIGVRLRLYMLIIRGWCLNVSALEYVSPHSLSFLMGFFVRDNDGYADFGDDAFR